MVSSMKERYEQLKKYPNISLNYDEILLFYPDYYKMKAMENGAVFTFIVTKDSTDTLAAIPYAVPMRDKPTLSTSGTFTGNISGTATTFTTITYTKHGSNCHYVLFRATGASFTAGQTGVVNGTNGSYMAWDAEL